MAGYAHLQQLLVHQQLANLGLECLALPLQGLNTGITAAPLETRQTALQKCVAPLRCVDTRLPRCFGLRRSYERTDFNIRTNVTNIRTNVTLINVNSSCTSPKPLFHSYERHIHSYERHIHSYEPRVYDCAGFTMALRK